MQAPDFSLPDQTGATRSLKDFAGKWLVLYFYLEDETSDCTDEACNFRDAHGAIGELGDAQVVGISKDSVESHKQFAKHHNLNFPLLSDPEQKTIAAYGAKGGPHGTLRMTFIISPAGEVAKVYEDVDAAKHAGEIINDLKQLQANA
ncbi:MAG TPA: peroxiredoxin [Candidatus Saccharimonadales bacterium]